jgi:hypothetical protein
MKKPIVLSAITAVVLLAMSYFAQAHAQESAKEEKPTFYRLTPGVYVNGWPRFTVTYPKDWVERHPMPQEIFRAVPPGGTGDVFSVVVATPPNGPLPLDKVADVVLIFFKAFGKDMTVVSDKPSQLSNGTPAREFQIQGIMNGLPFNYAGLSLAHGGVWISAQVSSQSGRIGEHLKAILYSLQYEASKDEPVKVPPDVQEFLDGLSSAWVSHDLAKLMSHYSDRFLNSGVRKGEMERMWRQGIGFTTSCEFSITDFIPAADRAYLTGFATFNGLTRMPMIGVSIVRENGEWKWYGNQRDASP